MEVSRRNYLAATGGALLAAGALSLPARAEDDIDEDDSVYGHAMFWNSNLPGEAGTLRLVLDFWANVEQGNGTGTAEDAVHHDWSMHFAVTSASATALHHGEIRFDITGVVTESTDPNRVGLPIVIAAETSRVDALFVAIFAM